MLRHKHIDRICCIVLAMTLLVSSLFVGAAATGVIATDTTIGYETRLFDQSRVHTIDIVMDGWEEFLDTATSEEYASCHLVIDGESYKNVAIRGKGNTSLSSVASYGNDRYSFKVEFDHYQSGHTYHGLDKLSLNNLIYDNTYMKDYFAYTLMLKMGVASPLCSFVQVNVNGEYWGLYLAVEGVEDAFLQRNYGKDYGELYKPDSMSFGGGRGNGADFDVEEFMENIGAAVEGMWNGAEGDFTMPDMSSIAIPDGFQMPEGFDPSQMMGSFGGSTGESAAATETATASPTPAPTETPAVGLGDNASFGMPAGGEMPGMGGQAGSFDPTQMMGGFGGSIGESAATDAAAASASPVPSPTEGMGDNASSGMPAGGTQPDTMQAMGSSGESAGTSATETVPAAMSTPPADRPTGDAPALSDDASAAGGMSAGFDPSQMKHGGDGRDKGGMGGGMGGGDMGSSDVKLQYADDDPSSYTNIFNNAKTDVTEADQARLIASLKALSEGDASVVDAEAVIRYMAVHNFLCNDDSYTGTIVHNYYLYEEDGVLSMIPWDYNLAYGGQSMGFGGDSGAASVVNKDIDTLVSNGSSGDRPMADWITASEEAMAQYLAIYDEFVATVFESGWFSEEIDRVSAMICPYVESDPTAFCTYEEFLTGAETLKEFCLKRAESVRNQLDGSDAQVDASGINLSDMGTMSGMGGGDKRGGDDFAERFRKSADNSGSGTENAPVSPATEGDGTTAPVGAEPKGNGTNAPTASGNGVDPGRRSATGDEAARMTVPTAGESTTDGSMAYASPMQPSFGGMEMRGMSGGTSATSAVPWLIASALVLAAALIFARFYPNKR